LKLQMHSCFANSTDIMGATTSPSSRPYYCGSTTGDRIHYYTCSMIVVNQFWWAYMQLITALTWLFIYLWYSHRTLVSFYICLWDFNILFAALYNWN